MSPFVKVFDFLLDLFLHCFFVWQLSIMEVDLILIHKVLFFSWSSDAEAHYWIWRSGVPY